MGLLILALILIIVVASVLILIFVTSRTQISQGKNATNNNATNKNSQDKNFTNKIFTISKSSYALGTIINLTIASIEDEEVIEKAFKRLAEIDDKLSAFKENSEISKIKSKAGIEPVIVSTDTYYVVKKSKEYSDMLCGAFDPTIRPLVEVWEESLKLEQLPSKDAIIEKLKLVNYKDIILDEEESSIMLKNSKQSIDLGGIAKGFAADEIRDIFNENKVKSGLIDLGGNVFAIGSKPDGTPWRIGIQSPKKSRGEYVGILNVINKSVVTSGNYEKYFIKDGRRIHHIIDPRTGEPSESRIISATIISDNSIVGDGVSTGAYIIGVSKATELINSIDGIEAIFITDDNKIHKTLGVDGIFTITDPDFCYSI